ncbi:hypothetical protein DMUE_0314 [Dictyocoela muelleri]|nr:hypothetical protein DMUE_0314 [Dictyocoela muelleri]
MGGSPQNRTEVLVIIEYDEGIKRVFACTIDAKTEEYIGPIICSQVSSNYTIWLNEHRAYYKLKDFNYEHDTVIHKYNFINEETGANTQAVECFNNLIKKRN